MLVFQSAGESLNFNPHLHGIIIGGVFDGHGSFHEIWFMNTEKLSSLFMHKVLSKLKRLGLIDDGVILQILSQEHSGFSAWLRPELSRTVGESLFWQRMRATGCFWHGILTGDRWRSHGLVSKMAPLGMLLRRTLRCTSLSR